MKQTNHDISLQPLPPLSRLIGLQYLFYPEMTYGKNISQFSLIWVKTTDLRLLVPIHPLKIGLVGNRIIQYELTLFISCSRTRGQTERFVPDIGSRLPCTYSFYLIDLCGGSYFQTTCKPVRYTPDYAAVHKAAC